VYNVTGMAVVGLSTNRRKNDWIKSIPVDLVEYLLIY
jgi:hypothetical protein